MIAVISIKKIIKKALIVAFLIIISSNLIKLIISNLENATNFIKFKLPSLGSEKIDIDLETSLINYGLITIEDLDEDYYIEDVVEEVKNEELKENNENANQEVVEENIELASKDVKTEVINTNIKENPNTNIRGVNIKNETSFNINESILDNSVEFKNKNILIFHTHTCESYTPTENMNYVASGNFRTTDLNYSVSRVGDELEKYLKNYGFNVLHNKDYHDYPAYSGSYTRSLQTVSNIIKQNNEFNLVFDLHRDAIGSNSSYAPKVKIGDEYCAQIMFVIGTNLGGLKHDNWIKNLSYAIKIQEKANEMYPGLFKTMIVRNSRYNQHLNDGASIIEIGATGNTLEECLNSMKYLSSVLNELF